MEQTLTQLPFWSSLTEREMDTLRRSAFVRHYKKGAFVHSSDNECLGMLFILSGEIRTYLLSDEGREVTLFRLVAAIEKHHEERYRALLHNVEMAEVFAKSEVKVWECRNCGHIVIGEKAPEVCPACNHPQSYFEIHAENY